MPSALARVWTTSMFCGWQVSETKKMFRPSLSRWHIVIASAQAVASSSSDALAMSRRGEVGDHRLEIQERFEAALGNFSLIRRVLRVPAGIFQNVALNHRRRDAIVIAHADERAADLVLRRDFLQRGERLMFGARGGQLQRTGEPDRFWNGGVNHRVKARVAELLEHFAGFGGTRADVAANKPVGMQRSNFQSKAIRGNYGSATAKQGWISMANTRVLATNSAEYNRFGWQRQSSATTNGVFWQKFVKLSLCKNGIFSYNFCT